MKVTLSRPQRLAAIACLWAVGVVAILAVVSVAQAGVVEVVHWSNGHLVRRARASGCWSRWPPSSTGPGT